MNHLPMYIGFYNFGNLMVRYKLDIQMGIGNKYQIALDSIRLDNSSNMLHYLNKILFNIKYMIFLILQYSICNLNYKINIYLHQMYKILQDIFQYIFLQIKSMVKYIEYNFLKYHILNNWLDMLNTFHQQEQLALDSYRRIENLKDNNQVYCILDKNQMNCKQDIQFGIQNIDRYCCKFLEGRIVHIDYLLNNIHLCSLCMKFDYYKWNMMLSIVCRFD